MIIVYLETINRNRALNNLFKNYIIQQILHHHSEQPPNGTQQLFSGLLKGEKFVKTVRFGIHQPRILDWDGLFQAALVSSAIFYKIWAFLKPEDSLKVEEKQIIEFSESHRLRLRLPLIQSSV